MQRLTLSDTPLDGATWAERSQGRLLAVKLADAGPEDAALANRYGHPEKYVYAGTNESLYALPVIHEGVLRFPITPGKGVAEWAVQIPAFGANSTLYIQWRQRFSREFMDTVFLMGNGQPPGVKLLILSEFLRSDTYNKLVFDVRDQHKFLHLYCYDQNGNTRNLECNIGGGDFDLQPVVGAAPSCTYNNAKAVNASAPAPGCWGLPVPGCATLPAEQWVTFDAEIITGDLIAGTNTWECERKLYMTVDGVKRLVIHYGKGSPGYVGRNARSFIGIWLGPYITNKSATQQYLIAPVDYRELIVDDQPIPSPLDEEDNMATIETVIAKQTDALNEAYAVAGLPSLAQQLADTQAALSDSEAKRANMITAAQNAKTSNAAATAAANAADAADNAALDAVIAAGS